MVKSILGSGWVCRFCMITHASASEDVFLELSVFWGEIMITAPAVSKSHLLDNPLIATLAYDGRWG